MMKNAFFSLMVLLLVNGCSNENGILSPVFGNKPVDDRRIENMANDHALLCFCDKDYLPYERFHQVIDDFYYNYKWNTYVVGPMQTDKFKIIPTNPALAKSLKINTYPTICSVNLVNGTVVKLIEGDQAYRTLQRRAEQTFYLEKTESIGNLKSIKTNVKIVTYGSTSHLSW